MSQLALVAKFEQEKEQKAAQAYQLAQQHVQEQKQKLRNLEQYRIDYLKQIQQTGMAGVGARHYNQHLSFVGKLDKACEQQLQVISKANLVADQRKQQWMNQQKRRKAVDMLIEKQKLAAQAKEARQEQRLMDEYASQRYFRNNHQS